MEIHCAECRQELKFSDQVVMNTLNSLTHRRCFIAYQWNIQDYGTYRYIKEKYSFYNTDFTRYDVE